MVLNSSQIRTLDNLLSRIRQIARGVQGPAGTGKTFVAAHEICAAVMEHDERVLVNAYQNSTVDNTMRFVIQLLKKRYGWSEDVIRRSVKRTGNLSKVANDIIPYFSNNFNELSRARIVGTTLHSSYIDIGHRMLQADSFDRIVMDESGQVTPEQAWISLRFLRENDNATITAYGDDNQLTPISPDFIPDIGVLRHLRTNNSGSVDLLDTTYRLNFPGVKMTSDLFYSGKLNAPPEVQNRRLSLRHTPSGPLSSAINADNTLVYIGVRGPESEDGLSYDNYFQAMTIADSCKELVEAGVEPGRIAVMAAYGPHVRTINIALNGSGTRCTTVHKMLGAENDVAIFATTRSNNSRDLGFLTQPELLNVATSRQLKKLIVVGDSGETFAEGSKTTRKMYDFIGTHGTLITLN
jgi:superfamily I DNA and/or RNA helicase